MKLPKQNQIVIYMGKKFVFISCNMGGKCQLKKASRPNKGMILKEIDITEILF